MKRSLLDEIECYDDGSAYWFPSLAQGSSEDRMIFGRAFFHQKKCLFLSKETRKCQYIF
jgi:hypothetical protein